MIEVTRKSGIILPASVKNTVFYADAKEHLVRRVKNYQDSAFTYYKFYLESDKGLLLPRFFPLSDYTQNTVIDKSFAGQDINISHNITPRNRLQMKAMQHMLSHESSIMQLEPGTGKTVITISVIADRKKKSLILVHRDTLVDQWKEAAYQFTNLKGDQVMRLTSANFEEAFQQPVIITTDQTFVSLLKRNRSNFLRALWGANIGVFVADEVHTSVGAPTFAECSIHIPAKVVYGLSATPYRHDGNVDIIQYHLGDIYVDDDVEGTMSGRVTVILFDFQIIQKRMKYIYWAGKFQRARYLNMLVKSQVFMKTVKGLLRKFSDREVILVADRIKLLDQLWAWSPETNKAKFTQNAGNDKLLFREVYATTMKVRDGVNIPQKDCLIMTAPISNISQITGRVLRSAEGKKEPIIVDLVDIGCGDICGTLHNRLSFYEMKKWRVNCVYLDSSGKYNQISVDDARQLINDKWGK